MRSTPFTVAAIAFGAICASSAPANAQALGRLLACADIPRADERLQCYDAAARSAIGLGGAPAAPVADSGAQDRRLQELNARLRRLEGNASAAGSRDPELRDMEARLKDLEAMKGASKSGVNAAAVSQREQELAAREAALQEREAKLAALSPGKAAAEEEATLFGIPIPFTKKDRFNQVEDLPNQKVVRDEDGVVEAIVANIAEFSYTPDEKLIMVLENGQVWRQTDGERLSLKASGDKPNSARISRGAMGSFNLNVNDSNRTVKVRRVDGVKGKR